MKPKRAFAQAAVPLWCGLLLLIGCAVQYLAWQFNLEWLRRPIHLFPAIYPWTIAGFFGTSLVLIFLAFAVRTGLTRYQVVAKALGITIGLVAVVFLLEHALHKPVGIFDSLLFKETLHKAGGSLPGRPAIQTCATLFLLAIAALVFHRENKRRVEAFQIIVLLGMFFPLLAIQGYLLSVTVFRTLGAKPTIEMSAPTLFLFCVSGVGFFSFFPEKGLVSLFLGKGVAGATIRRVIPTVIVVPAAAVWIVFWLTMRMHWPLQLSISLFTFLLMGLLVAVGFDIGYLIQRHEILQRATEKTLRDQALILDLANDTIFIRDREDRITYWNKGAQRLYGWSEEEAVGQVIHSLLETRFPQSLDSVRAQLLAAGHWEGELVHNRHDGSLVTVASSWTLQCDDANRPLSVIEMNYDITARKKAEQDLQKSKERLDAILSSSVDGIIVYDAVRNEIGVLQDLRFVMINPAAEKLMRRNASDLLGHTVLEKFPSVVSDGLFEKFTRIVEENVTLDFEQPVLE